MEHEPTKIGWKEAIKNKFTPSKETQEHAFSAIKIGLASLVLTSATGIIAPAPAEAGYYSAKYNRTFQANPAASELSPFAFPVGVMAAGGLIYVIAKELENDDTD